jgi:hypothetical protein
MYRPTLQYHLQRRTALTTIACITKCKCRAADRGCLRVILEEEVVEFTAIGLRNHSREEVVSALAGTRRAASR